MTVYVIKNKDYFKVGMTMNTLSKRLLQLAEKTHEPFKLCYFHHSKSEADSYRLEKAYHKRLERYNSRSEWFKNFDGFDRFWKMQSTFKHVSEDKRVRLRYSGDIRERINIRKDLSTLVTSSDGKYGRFYDYIEEEERPAGSTWRKYVVPTAIPFEVDYTDLLLGFHKDYERTVFEFDRINYIEWYLNEFSTTNGWFTLNHETNSYIKELEDISDSNMEHMQDYRGFVVNKKKTARSFIDIHDVIAGF